MYETYIFDLYGTLVDIHTDEESKKFWENMCGFFAFYGAEYEAEELEKKYFELVREKEKILKLKLEKKYPGREVYPEIDLFDVFKELYTEKGIEIDTEKVELTGKFFRTASTEYIHLYKGTIELLSELKRRGKRIVLLSNAQRIFTQGEIKALGIDSFFDEIFISSEFEVRKPDPEFFALPYKKYQLDKKKTIMIGNDQTTDIAGGRNFGFDTCYLHSNISPKKKNPVNSTYSLDPIDLFKLQKVLIV